MQIIRRIKRSIKGENKFRKVANEWLEYKKNSIKNSTYYNYKFIIEKYLNKGFGEQNIEKIKDYNQYIQELTKKLASKTIRDIICVLKAILKYYEEENDCKLKYKRMNIPKLEKKEIKILSSKERIRLEKYCLKENTLKSLGILLSLNTGLRIGEICALKWENIDLKEKNIYVKKTLQRVYDTENKKTKIIIDKPKTENSIRCIPLNSNIYGELNKIRKGFSEKDFFLTGADGIYIEPRVYQNYYKNMLKSSKVKEYNFHVLRHTFATNCIEVGMDIKSLSEILGHATVDITLNRYVHSSRKMKEKYLEKL